jgi:ligand-binding SRPBCC domain-containing protein
VLLTAVLLAVAAFAATATSRAADSIKQIDTECNAIQDAVMALHPIHVAYRSGNWIVLSDADYTVAERTKASVTFADVYKQGSKYAWVHAHSFTSTGKQRATQLCFRQSNGTLERARQAATVPNLAAASAQQAYYTSSGKLIQKTAIFEENDPMLAKTIQALPFYNVLPK